MVRRERIQSPPSRQVLILVPVLGLALALADAHAAVPAGEAGQPPSADAVLLAESSDVIATVGDQGIHFRALTQELDQGAVAGVSVPGYGTPERREVMERLLDDAIRNELLYLDALRKGVDQEPAYQAELERFQESLLAGLFRERQAATEEARQQWRQGIPIVIHEDALDPAGDASRDDDEVLATVGDATVTWGDAKARLQVATRRAAISEGATDAATERGKVLDQQIDLRVMAIRAREAGLEQDPAYLQQLTQYKRMGVAGIHYRQLAKEMAPSEAEVEAYAQTHGQTADLADERMRNTITRALTEQKIDEYVAVLRQDQFPVTVDEGKLDLLLAQEAERHAAAPEGARTE